MQKGSPVWLLIKSVEEDRQEAPPVPATELEERTAPAAVKTGGRCYCLEKTIQALFWSGENRTRRCVSPVIAAVCRR
ncbi:hypothetical protein MRB53_017859 [Persea americana]|uniref:Uncharacterized protein n=1 Tax=Persea americana TaxID=3435 RepID=A0ACC2M685_PERAE|nr:hypothetical protein MRB53_017859 [Persea americana]